MKNLTRIAALLGTWTAETRIKTTGLLGTNELTAYFVVHFMPDPMRGYGCGGDGQNEKEKCNELNNSVCVRHVDNHDDHHRCVDLAENVVDWSDLAVFLYFGAQVDVEYMNVHMERNTGGWIGPFNVIMAQNNDNKKNNNDTNNGGNVVVDAYTVRYVQTPGTPYLQTNVNCTIFEQTEFDHYMGLDAVNATAREQVRVQHGQDPYAPHLGTCINGNVEPILPLFQFEFTKNNNKAQDQQEESLTVLLDYKIMVMPYKHNLAYKWMPTIKRIFNAGDYGGFKVSGPYCYGDDPHRAWTFDLNYNSTQHNKKDDVITLRHGCLPHLPCLPAASALADDGRKQHFGPSNDTDDDGGGDGGGGGGDEHVIDVTKVLYKLAVYLLSIVVLLQCICCVHARGRYFEKVEELMQVREEQMVARASSSASPANDNNNGDEQQQHEEENDDEQQQRRQQQRAPAAAAAVNDSSSPLLQPLLLAEQSSQCLSTTTKTTVATAASTAATTTGRQEDDTTATTAVV